MASIVEKRLPNQRNPLRNDLLANYCCVATNLLLSVLVHSQIQEMKQIVQINLPICFSVRRQRQILSSLFSGYACGKARLIGGTSCALNLGFRSRKQFSVLPRHTTGTALSV